MSTMMVQQYNVEIMNTTTTAMRATFEGKLKFWRDVTATLNDVSTRLV
jgi:hypothetical protein